LPGIKIGTDWLFRKDKIDAMLDNHSEPARAVALVQAIHETIKTNPVTAVPVQAPPNVVIVSRHPGVTEWVYQHYPQYRGAPTYGFANRAQIENKIVLGPLPFRLAATAKMVGIIELPRRDVTRRGDDELTAKEMDEAGATLVWYKVTKVEK
jgi:hypothetical protein